MISLDLRVDDNAWRALDDLDAVCQRALDAAAGCIKRDGEVSLLLCDDEAIRSLNRDWRYKDRSTDVLSFPAAEIDAPFLGDIAVAHGVALADARAKNIGLAQHLSHLLIHGLLHLCGYDHLEDAEADEMEAFEISALASLGWPDPYV